MVDQENVEPSLRRGFVISDLHLFAERSAARDYLEHFHCAASLADFFVLNGDIFDFRWTVLESVEETVFAAVDWLRDLVKAHPSCRFYYTLGNHDCLHLFAEHLAALVDETDNFEWNPSHFRLGKNLFAHGDLLLKRGNGSPFTRKLVFPEAKKGPASNLGYRLLVRSSVHRSVSLIQRRRRCARRIYRALGRDPGEVTRGVTDVYFGHTHVAFSNYRYRGLTFHNTGSTISGMKLNMLPVEVESDASLSA